MTLRFLKFLTIAIIASRSLQATSNSIYVKRQITTDPTYELALSNFQQRHYLTHTDSHCGFSIKPFYQQSARNALARYFMPNCKNPVQFKEDGSGDVDPLWLEGIANQTSQYASKVCLNPKMSQWGGVVNMYGNMETILDGLWISLNTTFMNVTTQLNLTETMLSGTGTGTGVIQCLNKAQGMLSNCAWKYGKFLCGKQSRFGMDDLQIKLGYDVVDRAHGHLGLYLVGTIPTGTHPRNFSVFEPLVGSRNGSFGFGINTDYIAYMCDNHVLSWMFDFKYRYVFSACTRRSFDLKANGDWSRLMLVAQQANPSTPLPAINFLTLPAKVTPQSTIEMWTGLHYERSNWQFEGGYNFWWKDAEKIKLKSSVKNGIAIFDLQGAAVGAPVSASTANISQTVASAAFGHTNLMTSDTVFTPITTSEINICSGAQPSAYSNKIYASCGYQWCYALVGINASYEFGQKNRALENWGIWATTSIQF